MVSKDTGTAPEERIERLLKRQTALMFFSAAVALLTLIAAVCFVSVVPRLVAVLEDASEIASKLGEIDFAGIAESVGGAAVSAQRGIAEAMEKIDRIDIEGLNEAINGLKTAVGPLARLFG